MPTAATVEELSPAWQEGEDMFEVGGGARRGTERRRVERASPHGEEEDARDAASVSSEATECTKLSDDKVPGLACRIWLNQAIEPAFS